MPNRCAALWDLMVEAGLEAAYITKPEHIRYLSGYAGEGALFVCGGAGTVITDFRYFEQCEREAPDCGLARITLTERQPQLLKTLLEARGLARVAFEPDVVTVSELDGLKAAMPDISFVSLGGLPEKMRRVKDAQEIECVVRAAAIACEAFERLVEWVKPGMTERQIQQKLDFTMLELGSEAVAFETIAAGGPNGSLPHAVPSDRPVQNGELLTLDFGAQVNGYKCDMTRTIAFGEVSQELKDMYNAVAEAQRLAYEKVCPGADCKAVEVAARDHLEARYPGAFGHSLGHGVGLEIHETPNFSMRSTDTLCPGNVMTVEPGVYIPGLGGVRIEDMAIITEDGYFNPITANRALITV